MFWVHSYKARRLKREAQEHAERVIIAKAALAGWRFIKRSEKPMFGGGIFYEVVDPKGVTTGTNDTLTGAAAYAAHVMEQR